ncbi:MAG: MurR/RpiR family transcriptional regulator [Phycisphaerales bacterium]|nr:MurR/RpiR family transcriptional regulator [Phycisphaerales bacterium]
MSLQELIAPVSDRLTPTERRICALLLEDATLLAFGTVSDIAGRVGTSRPSIVRFANKLGFDGFTSLQGWVRQDLAKQLSTPSQRIRRREGEGPGIRAALEQAVRQTLETLDDRRLEALAAPIARARAVWILSGETSMAGAIVLHSGLSMVRPGVNLVHEQTAARQLCSARPGDAAVVYDFARYRRHSVLAARTLAELGVEIVAITDSPMSPLASLTKTWCKLHIPAAGPFDSALPSVLTSEMITARVVEMLGGKAHAQIDRLEGLWQGLGTFLEYVPRGEKGRGEG